ncbi:MAG TPA: metalloregulator ArsR/SmtB family transcription factor [Thermoanaerobaculia bacterium]|nr:metalloregulator ArsR/SmtB family transcription factor [Thermoanaerobaculia bacterium]HSK76222.1 metalloregulator ArsR/SmtB family transcription factor [Thermoanaerobaculia bacterium]HSN88212.1 metalloregulator ArsR/SmtB family transcription factor [Thermoanaerobaculia bacterium]
MIEPISIEPAPALDPLAERLKALADPTRLHILRELARGPLCACRIQARVGVAANLLSHHLKVLREAELISATRHGRWIDYALDSARLEALRRAIPGAEEAP